MERLISKYLELLDQTPTTFVRHIHDQIDWSNQMLAIVGSRGVGKTTLLLQHIKSHLPKSQTLYINADDLYFSDNSLLELAETFHKNGGLYLFVDEIHKYPNWSKEMKLIYDYLPKLKVVFTGSSILDIFKGTSDLSRRVVLYNMYGLSFREYLNMNYGLSLPTYSIDQIVNHEVKAEGVEFPLAEFHKYLHSGYYPFSLSPGFTEKLNQIINTTLENDIPMYAKMNMTSSIKLKRLLAVVSKSVPFKPNYSKLSQILAIDRNTLNLYVEYMTRAELVSQLFDSTSGIRGLGKVEKLYLNNTNLIYALSGATAETGNVRETFFLNQMKVTHRIVASPVSDFLVNDMTFELGGKGKGKTQIAGTSKSFVVKDDILYGFGNTIPLWHFGFTY